MSQRFRVLQELGEQFERASETRDLFEARAVNAESRLPATGFGARISPRRQWRVVGAAGGLLIAVVVALIVLLLAGSPAVDAGWAAVPQAPNSAVVATVLTKCYRLEPESGRLGSPVLTEARGYSTAAIYVIDSTVYMCRYDSTYSAVTADSMGPVRKPPRADQLSIPYGVWGGGGSGRLPQRLTKALRHTPISRATFLAINTFQDGGGYGFSVVGQAGRDISSVRFAFAHHQTVTATVQHGWYFAWWPWDSDPSAVTVKTNSGTATSAMRNAWPGGFGSRPYPACKPGTSTCVFAKKLAAATRRTAAATTPVAQALAIVARSCNASTLNGDVLPAEVFAGQPVVADVHGMFTALVNVTNGVVYACVTGGDQKDIHAFYEQSIGAFGHVRRRPGPDQLSVPYTEKNGVGGGRVGPSLKGEPPGLNVARPLRRDTPAQSQARQERVNGGGYGPYTFGQAGSDVSAVRFSFANHKTVDAIVQNGWYFAWWPWVSNPTSVTVLTSSGTITSPLTSTNTMRNPIAPGCHPGSNDCVFIKTHVAA